MKKKYILIIILFILIFYSVSYLGNLIESKMSNYVTEEINRVSKIVIRYILDEEFLESLDLENLYSIEMNPNQELEIINFNTQKVNNILGKINDKLINSFNDLDNGDNEILSKNSTIFNRYISGKNKGLYINVPLGIIFSNPIIVNMGPSIPIKLLLNGQIESDIKTSIRQYGINSVLLEIYVNINVIEKIILPFSSKYVIVNLDIPIVMELISGKVPDSYLNSKNFDILE